MTEFVVRGGLEIEGEIQALMTEGVWSDVVDDAPLGCDASAIIRVVTLRIAGEYDRRFMQAYVKAPLYRMLWLGYNLPTVCCAERVRIAILLRDTADDRLHVTCRKVKKLFAAELQLVISTEGQIVTTLWILFRT